MTYILKTIKYFREKLLITNMRRYAIIIAWNTQ